MVDVGKLLDQLGIPYQEIGNDYRTKCWFHEEKNPSMSIDKEGGYYHCFSCKRSGTVFSILNHFLGVAGVDALRYLGSMDTVPTTKEEEKERYEKLKEEVELRGPLNQISRRIIVDLPKHKMLESHPYLEKRGITREEIKEWQISKVIEQPYDGWIMIPIYKYGKLRNYFLRSPFDNRKLYGKYPVADLLVGLDTASDLFKPIYVVEGIFDMIFLRRTGVQVVAALTNRLYSNTSKLQSELLNDKQLELLRKFEHVVIVPDTDDPGYQLVKDALNLSTSSKVGVCKLPQQRKDAAECSLRELFQIVKSEKPIEDYIILKVRGIRYGNEICNIV